MNSKVQITEISIYLLKNRNKSNLKTRIGVMLGFLLAFAQLLLPGISCFFIGYLFAAAAAVC